MHTNADRAVSTGGGGGGVNAAVPVDGTVDVGCNGDLVSIGSNGTIVDNNHGGKGVDGSVGGSAAISAGIGIAGSGVGIAGSVGVGVVGHVVKPPPDTDMSTSDVDGDVPCTDDVDTSEDSSIPIYWGKSLVIIVNCRYILDPELVPILI